MANDGQIVFEITADGKHAKAAIKDITKAINAEAKNWDRAAKESTDNIESGFSGMLKKIGGAIVAAKIGQKLLQIGKDAIQAASDLQEVQNVVDVTFGESASTIDKWAKNAITQFGLTETQAKRFASTMGAMMKSSGLAGEEIVNMSTDLAGLAADMASFYNLDFDTAFQKIRSGISGETEPLKQLGINMSVANLNAYALQKGLSKTFDEMTQGEQVMLRYQYLMSATSDAQGDFADTVDGYANSMRLLQSNIDQIKSNLGGFVTKTLANATKKLNEFITELTTPPEETLFDKVEQIQIDLTDQIETIGATKALADELISKLDELGNHGADGGVRNIAEGANALKADSKENWIAILGALKDIDGLQNIFSTDSNASNNIESLANALSSSEVSTEKAEAWATFLGALSENADAVSNLTGSSVDETQKWLSGLAQTAKELTPEDAEAWNTLLTAFVKGIGESGTDKGNEFVQNLATQFLSLGQDSEFAVYGLKALGFTTDEITEKQAAWLEICRALVRTIPGMSELIDTNTGEVKGGIATVQQYADEWERVSKYQAEIAALREQKGILEDIYDTNSLKGVMYGKRAVIDSRLAAKGVNRTDAGTDYVDWMADMVRQGVKDGKTAKDLLNDVKKAKYGYNYGDGQIFSPYSFWNKLTGDQQTALEEYLDAVYKYEEALELIPYLEKAIDEGEQRVADEYGVDRAEVEKLTDATNAANEAQKGWDATTQETAKKNIPALQSALQDLEDYYEGVRASVEKTVDSIVKGFDKIGKAGDESREKSSDLAEQEKDLLETYASEYKDFLNADGTVNLAKMQENFEHLSKTGKEAYNALAEVYNEQIKVNKALDQYNPANMKAGLDSQVEYMKEYLKNLETVRSYGVSDELLAMLSDGSTESAEYLAQLAHGGKEAAQEVDQAYAAVTEQKKEFTDALTKQQLTVDQTYDNLVAKAKEAIAALDLRSEAEKATDDTMNGIVTALKDNVDDVGEAVDAIISQLNRLSGWGITVDFAGFGSIDFTTIGGENAEGSGRYGLDFIPHDDYIARLHEGERVLTAQENQIWNSLRNSGIAGFSLDDLGGVMRDNVRPGGNVYLDGKIVGSVISDQQGKSYRQLQRSGWQG